MQFKTWGVRLALTVMVLGILGCQLTDSITSIAQAPSATATRTRARATFTPQPPATETAAPTNPPPPPTQAPPTVRPTSRPLPTATRRPPTAVPPPVVVAPTSPPKPQYQFSADHVECEHSGSSWIKGHVYSDKNDSSSAVPGLKIVFGDSGGGAYAPPVETDGNGDFAFTLTADGAGPAKSGAYYVWITDRSGARISSLAGPININGKKETEVDSCWAGKAFFYQNY